MRNCDIQSIFDLAFQANKMEPFPIKVEWSNKMTSCAGKASRAKQRIKLSIPIFQATTETEQEQIIYHEVCHLIQKTRYPYSKPHGYEWAQCMRACLRKPDVYHKIFINPKGGILYDCVCGQKIPISPTISKRIKNGRKYKCMICKRSIQLCTD
jgi:predicted SprT family Zn-dependent metalloprotease